MKHEKYGYVQPIFPTLRSAGYHHCEHYRFDEEVCMDCGAERRNGTWLGGHLEFRRLPHRYVVPQDMR